MRLATSYLAVAVLVALVTYALAQVHQAPQLQPAPQPNLPARPITVQPTPPPAPQGAPANDLDLSPEERTNICIYQGVNRSVVNITTRSVQPDDFLLFSEPREGSGSGSILDRQGHILTNYHVIEGARQIAVTLFDGSTHRARLIGSDPNNDLAVLRVNAAADKLCPIRWGDSTRLLVGMRVYAIGNP